MNEFENKEITYVTESNFKFYNTLDAKHSSHIISLQYGWQFLACNYNFCDRNVALSILVNVPVKLSSLVFLFIVWVCCFLVSLLFCYFTNMNMYFHFAIL